MKAKDIVLPLIGGGILLGGCASNSGRNTSIIINLEQIMANTRVDSGAREDSIRIANDLEIDSVTSCGDRVYVYIRTNQVLIDSIKVSSYALPDTSQNYQTHRQPEQTKEEFREEDYIKGRNNK